MRLQNVNLDAVHLAIVQEALSHGILVRVLAHQYCVRLHTESQSSSFVYEAHCLGPC